jgi:outer membrane protein assembly factor BamD (BamD/ComL family)
LSVSGISSTDLSNYETQNTQSNFQKVQQEFQQLGQDLQSGNLSAAQSDFATLQSLQPQSNSTSSASSSQSNNPVAQAFNQLSQDLQSGNLTAAQQDFATIQQDLQSQAAQGTHHHHHHGSEGGENSAIGQAFQQLGQALQSGNLTSAQQAYITLQQDFQSSGTNSGQTQGSSLSGSTSTVTA